MQKGYVMVWCVAVVCAMVCADATAMNKAELIEAMASKSGLSKADAKKALDGFLNTTTKALADGGGGGRVSLGGFGSFSVSKRASSTGGCSSESSVAFYASGVFHASERAQEPPFGLRIAEVARQDDGTVWVLGPSQGDYRHGDDAVVRTRPGPPDWIDPDDDGDGLPVVCVGVLFSMAGSDALKVAPVDCARCMYGEVVLEQDQNLEGLVLRGIEKSAIRRGMIVAAPGLTELPPGGDCDDGNPDVRPISTDGDILAGMIREARLSERAAVALYNALLDTIVAEVNAGEEVDIEGFGAFYEAQETAISKRSARTGRNPQTGKEIKIATKNVSRGEQGRIGALTRQLARRWAREGSGAEVTVTTKNKVKFKAGAELSGQVN